MTGVGFSSELELALLNTVIIPGSDFLARLSGPGINTISDTGNITLFVFKDPSIDLADPATEAKGRDLCIQSFRLNGKGIVENIKQSLYRVR